MSVPLPVDDGDRDFFSSALVPMPHIESRAFVDGRELDCRQ